jgi:Chaperone of endosialidase
MAGTVNPDLAAGLVPDNAPLVNPDRTGTVQFRQWLRSVKRSTSAIQSQISALFANPTASVGLTAVNGTATTAMRSDAAPRLNQGISPTWTGAHTFSNAITVTGAGSSLKGNVNIVAPTSGNTLTVNGIAGGSPIVVTPGSVTAPALTFTSAGNTGIWSSAAANFDIATASTNRVNINSTGNITANAAASGTTLTVNGAGSSPVMANFAAAAGSIAFVGVQDGQTGTHQYLLSAGFPAIGNFCVYDNTVGATRVFINTGGTFTISQPTSGVAAIINGISGNKFLDFFSSAGAASDFAMGWAVGFGPSWNIFTQSTDPLAIGSAGAAAVSLITNSATRISVGSTGTVAISAATAGESLTVAGLANSFAEHITGSATSGQSFGLIVDAGTTLADHTVNFRSHSGTSRFVVFGDGSGFAGPNSTNSMSWDSSGRFFFAAPPAGSPLSTQGVAGSNSASFTASTTTGSSFGPFLRGGTNSSDYNLACVNSANTLTYFEVRGDGAILMPQLANGSLSVAGGVVTSSSDIRLKKDIREFTKSIDGLLGVTPITYRWDKEASGIDCEDEFVGFSAQNLEEFLPEAVHRDANGVRSVNDKALIAALINSVKELKAELHALKAKVQ